MMSVFPGNEEKKKKAWHRTGPAMPCSSFSSSSWFPISPFPSHPYRATKYVRKFPGSLYLSEENKKQKMALAG